MDVCPQILLQLSDVDKFTWSVRLALALWEVCQSWFCIGCRNNLKVFSVSKARGRRTNRPC